MAEQNTVLLIDAENIPPSLAAVILDAAKRQGFLLHRCVYGDFSRPALAPWREAAVRHALTARQTIAGASGKNGADIALVIDAMDLLYTTDAMVFCLVTCDGDFTQLAMRIRQAGRTVVGMGMSHVSERFRSACDAFKVIGTSKTQATSTVQPSKSGRTLAADILQHAFVTAPPLDGEWVGLPDLMKVLKARQPDFEVKAYGHNQLSKLLAASGVELTDKNRKARLRKPILKKVVDNG